MYKDMFTFCVGCSWRVGVESGLTVLAIYLFLIDGCTEFQALLCLQLVSTASFHMTGLHKTSGGNLWP